MMCPFCKQDVNDPCRDAAQIEQRAQNHVERCERALGQQHAMGGESKEGKSGEGI